MGTEHVKWHEPCKFYDDDDDDGGGGGGDDDYDDDDDADTPQNIDK